MSWGVFATLQRNKKQSDVDRFGNRSKTNRYYQFKITENNLFSEAAIRGEFVIVSLRLHKTLMNADNTTKLMVMAIYRI